MRYIRLYKTFFKNCFIRDMEYRGGFFTSFLSSFTWVFMQIFFFNVIFGNINTIGGWRYPEMLFLVGVFLFLDSTIFALFVKNFNFFNNYVRLGELDMVLTKPVNSQFFVSFRFFANTHLFHVPVGIVVMFIAIQKLGVEIEPLRFMLFIASLIVSIIICYSLWFIITSLVFFLEKVDELHEVFISFWQFAKFPDIYSKSIRTFFMAVLPVVFTAYVPSGIILRKVDNYFVAYYFLIALILLFLTTKIWKICLKNYVSASS